eukprot:2464185-Amphidinium_carterae.1
MLSSERCRELGKLRRAQLVKNGGHDAKQCEVGPSSPRAVTYGVCRSRKGKASRAAGTTNNSQDP